MTVATTGLSELHDLKVDEKDAIGAYVRSIEFRGQDYAIYRSERGIYVHFSDDQKMEQAQRAAYVKLSPQICELRYLTSQMRPGVLGRFFNRWSGQDTLYDHNMAQALMLLMETTAMRARNDETGANATEKEASDIANRALDMAVKRNHHLGTLLRLSGMEGLCAGERSRCHRSGLLSHRAG
jgi:hypothetical protein